MNPLVVAHIINARQTKLPFSASITSASPTLNKCVNFVLHKLLKCKRKCARITSSWLLLLRNWSGVSDLDISLNWLEAPKGGLPYERDGDARRKVGIKTLKDRSGRGSSLIILSPKGDRAKTDNQNKSYSDLNCAWDVYIECCILLFDFRSIVIRLS